MSGFPLLLIPLAVCNIIVFLMPGVSFAAPLFTLPLYSGAGWPVTLSDALVAFGLLLLLLEVQKSARPGGKYVTDHLLALLIFAGAAAEFVMLPPFANATFFLLTLIALVDFLSGLALRGRRPKRVREAAAPAPLTQPTIVPITPSPAPYSPLTPPQPNFVPRAEPVRVEPIRPEPIRPEPVQVELNRADPAHEAPSRAEPPPVEAARVEPIVDMDPMLDDPASEPKDETKIKHAATDETKAPPRSPA